MTTTATHSYVELIANGTAPLPFNFQSISATEIGVRRNGADIETGFTIVRNADGTGTVTPATSWGSDEIVIYSKPNYGQPATFPRFAPLYPDQLESLFDRFARTLIAFRGSLDLEFGDANVEGLRQQLLAGTGGALVGTLASGAGAVKRSLQDKLRDVVSVKDYGAKGDGATDDTAAFIAAIAASGDIIVPAGTYMLDYITISKQVHIAMASGAVLKQRVPVSPVSTLNAHWGIFKLTSGAAGSTISGGTIDGNRAALAPYYNGYTRLGQDNHWWGIRVEFADDVTLDRVRFRNCFYEGFYAFGCERFRALDFDIADCGVAFQAQGLNAFSQGWVLRGQCRNIGNVIGTTPYYIFQHGITIGSLSNSLIDISMRGFAASKVGVDGSSTSGGKEPVPIAMNLYLLEGCDLNLSARDYTTIPSQRGVHTAFNFSSVNGCRGRLSAFGFEAGLAASTSSGNQLDIDFDGDFLQTVGYSREGLLLTHGGVSPPNGASLAGEAGSNLSSRDNAIRGSIRRFGIGVRDEGEGNDYSGLSVYGNITDGMQLTVAAGTSASYPAARRRVSGGRSLIGANVYANGNAGIIYTGGTGDRIVACYVRDNGQTFGSRPQPYNLAVVADVGEGVDLQIIDNDIDITPSVTRTNEISYAPGTATAKASDRVYSIGTALTHTYPFVARNVNAYSIGDIIRLKGVAGGADADGKVIDIDEDQITLAFASAVTFTDGPLDTLTGTASTSGINVLGTGTAFIAEIDFPAYLKKGTEYRRIVYVNSDTSAVIDGPFSSNMAAGSTLQVVRADVVTGVITAANGLNINGNVTVGPMTLRNNLAENVSNAINYLSFAGIAAGSRYDVDYAVAMAGTALSNAIVTGLPIYSQVRAVKAFLDTAVTGTTGTNTVQIKDGATLLSTPVTFGSTASGTVGRGPANTNPAFLSTDGGVHFVSSAGNPSGTVRARVTIDQVA